MKANNQNEVWIIDTDFTDDDILALEILLPKIKVIAITVVGRKDKNPSAIKKDIEKFLSEKNLEKVEIFLGADRPFINYQEQLKDDEIHCPYMYLDSISSSAGNTEEVFSSTDLNEIKQKLNSIASVKIVSLCQENKGKVNILTTGPLTNLGLAALLDNDLSDYVNSFLITGGSIRNLGNSGNMSEYNFRYDPVGAKNFFHYSKKSKIYLNPIETEYHFKNGDNHKKLLELIKKSSFAHNFEELNKKTPMIEEFNQIYHSNLAFYSSLLLLNCNIVKKAVTRPLMVDVFGRYSRGCLLVDGVFIKDEGKKCHVDLIEEIDEDALLETARKIFA